MAAFELNDFSPASFQSGNAGQQSVPGQRPGTIPENIICLKIYDSCRQQDCLGFDEIGPARAAENIPGSTPINEGDIIIAPNEAASVTMDEIVISRIAIVDKRLNCFKKGYWDVEIKYVIEYRLTFRNSNAEIIRTQKAKSICNRKITLFGSESCDLYSATDLFSGDGVFEEVPFIQVEAKPICLTASIVYDCCQNMCGPFPGPQERRGGIVEVTIGLFSIVKLFRMVDLTVESRGFSVPEECADICPMNPCEYFDTLDFPMDIFAPPQRPEFLAGISCNIPAKKKDHDHCHCD